MRWRIHSASWIGLALMTLVVSAIHGGAAEAAAAGAPEARCEMTSHDGRLTAQIAEAPLRQVLEELQRLSGVQAFVSPAEGETRVSVETTDLPLGEAVARILHGRNHALLYAPRIAGGQVTQIWVFGHSTAPASHSAASSAADAATAQRSADVDGVSQDVTPTAPLEALEATAATAFNDSGLRIQALGLLFERAAEDPSAMETVTAIAQNDPDPQVRSAASALAGLQAIGSDP